MAERRVFKVDLGVIGRTGELQTYNVVADDLPTAVTAAEEQMKIDWAGAPSEVRRAQVLEGNALIAPTAQAGVRTKPRRGARK